MNEVNLPRINFRFRIMKTAWVQSMDTARANREKLAMMGIATSTDSVRGISNKFLQAGFIKRPKNCENCGKECKPDGHHEDYTKPLMLTFLCKKCHFKRHAYLRSIGKSPSDIFRDMVNSGDPRGLPSLESYSIRFGQERSRIFGQ